MAVVICMCSVSCSEVRQGTLGTGEVVHRTPDVKGVDQMLEPVAAMVPGRKEDTVRTYLQRPRCFRQVLGANLVPRAAFSSWHEHASRVLDRNLEKGPSFLAGFNSTVRYSSGTAPCRAEAPTSSECAMPKARKDAAREEDVTFSLAPASTSLRRKKSTIVDLSRTFVNRKTSRHRTTVQRVETENLSNQVQPTIKSARDKKRRIHPLRKIAAHQNPASDSITFTNTFLVDMLVKFGMTR